MNANACIVCDTILRPPKRPTPSTKAPWPRLSTTRCASRYSHDHHKPVLSGFSSFYRPLFGRTVILPICSDDRLTSARSLTAGNCTERSHADDDAHMCSLTRDHSLNKFLPTCVQVSASTVITTERKVGSHNDWYRLAQDEHNKSYHIALCVSKTCHQRLWLWH